MPKLIKDSSGGFMDHVWIIIDAKTGKLIPDEPRIFRTRKDARKETLKFIVTRVKVIKADLTWVYRKYQAKIR